MIHIRSVVLPQVAALNLESSSWPWDDIHRAGKEVDSLPNYPPAVAECLIDWLASEAGLQMPLLSRVELQGAKLACSTRRHAAKVFAQQLKSIELKSAREICAAYGEIFDGRHEWIDYLARQWTHLENEDDIILVIVHD